MANPTSLDESLLTRTLSGRHTYMILAELATLSLYIGSMVLLPEYFGMSLALFAMSRLAHISSI